MDKFSKLTGADGQKLELDPIFELEMERLHRLTVYGRWVTVLALWVSVGAWSLWQLRYNIGLLQEHFTWAAVRYGLHFNPFPTLGLSVCIGMTAGVLVWQSRNVLFGLSKSDQKRLLQQVRQIRHEGRSHPLWKWVCQH